jgi:hypothetical protein
MTINFDPRVSARAAGAVSADGRPWENGCAIAPRFDLGSMRRHPGLGLVIDEARNIANNAMGFASTAVFGLLNSGRQVEVIENRQKHVQELWTSRTPQAPGSKPVSRRDLVLGINEKLPNDRIDLAVGITVSRHDLGMGGRPFNQAEFDRRKATDTYTIKVTSPDGTTASMTGIPAFGHEHSADGFTVQAISIPLKGPGLYVVEAWPGGSMGSGGFKEGRTLHINVAGKR